MVADAKGKHGRGKRAPRATQVCKSVMQGLQVQYVQENACEYAPSFSPNNFPQEVRRARTPELAQHARASAHTLAHHPTLATLRTMATRLRIIHCLQRCALHPCTAVVIALTLLFAWFWHGCVLQVALTPDTYTFKLFFDSLHFLPRSPLVKVRSLSCDNENNNNNNNRFTKNNNNNNNNNTYQSKQARTQAPS